jgi:hypothetical protein
MRILLVAAALLLVLPTSASAADVHWTAGSRGGPAQVVFSSAPGERNDVTLSRDGAVHVRVADAGAPINPQQPCVAITAQEARCPAGRVSVSLGDGDDRASLVAVPATVHGEAGDDVLIGSDGDDHLLAGEGSDRADGRGGHDGIQGDGLGPVAPDRLSGGPGIDSLDYSSHPGGVTATLGLETRFAGSGNEDTVDGFENVSGSRYFDMLVGDDGPNVIHAGAGGDRVAALAGDDTVSALVGDVVLGPGDDTLLGAPKVSVDCGPGADVVDGRRMFDEVNPNCEHWKLYVGSQGAGLVPVEPWRTGRRVLVRMPCPKAVRGRCVGTIAIRRSGPASGQIGRCRISVPAGSTARCRGTLSRAEFRRVRLVDMQVDVQFRIRPSGSSSRATWDGFTTTLRRDR